jgi:hypothetical protein
MAWSSLGQVDGLSAISLEIIPEPEFWGDEVLVSGIKLARGVPMKGP